MKISLTRTLQVSLNIFLIVFSYATYSLFSQQIKDIFVANDKSLNQQKSDFIAKSIRPLAPTGDYVGMRTAFKNALNDSAIQMLRFMPTDASEGVCVANGESCYATAKSNESDFTSTIYFDSENSQPMGTIQVRFLNEGSAKIDRTIRTYLGLALLLIVTLFNFITFLSFRSIRRQIQWSFDAVKRITHGEEVPLQKSILVEKTQFTSVLQKLKDLLQEYKSGIERESKKAALVEVAKKVAHDIRDPLLALDSTLSFIDSMPENKRILTRNAISRIRDIANGLIRQNDSVSSERKEIATSKSADNNTELLSSLIEMILSEKRLQFKSKKNIQIDSDLEEKSYGLFVNINSSDLSRVLSNLINNAVDAVGVKANGKVFVRAEGTIDKVIISISDNGHGMTEEIKKQILSHGGSFGKDQGSGIGFRSAVDTVSSLGGQIEIDSKVGDGTTVKIILPRSRSPKWFVPELNFSGADTVCILDDDQSIHRVWDYRFKLAGIDTSAMQVFHFSNANDLISWKYANESSKKNITYLCDYELIGQQLNGLETIKILNIEANSILVTSRYDESHIRNECETRGIRMIPKPLAGLVPISWIPEMRTYASL